MAAWKHAIWLSLLCYGEGVRERGRAAEQAIKNQTYYRSTYLPTYLPTYLRYLRYLLVPVETHS